MHLRVYGSAGAVMIIIKLLMMVAGLFLLVALPQWIDGAVNLLPQPLPQIIGVVMFIGVATVFIGVLNKLMKGTN
jgi:hypothetical protein